MLPYEDALTAPALSLPSLLQWAGEKKNPKAKNKKKVEIKEEVFLRWERRDGALLFRREVSGTWRRRSQQGCPTVGVTVEAENEGR